MAAKKLTFKRLKKGRAKSIGDGLALNPGTMFVNNRRKSTPNGKGKAGARGGNLTTARRVPKGTAASANLTGSPGKRERIKLSGGRAQRAIGTGISATQKALMRSSPARGRAYSMSRGGRTARVRVAQG